MSTNKKILVGMSGGVDSAVVAAILAKQGNEVIAYTLKLLESFSVDEDGEEDNSKGCCSFEDISLRFFFLPISPNFNRINANII